RLSRRPGLHLRAVSVAVLDIGGRRLAVGCTHLDLEERARLEYAREALDHLDRAALRYDAPAVLAGDVNCGPDGEAWRYLTRGLADAAAAAPLGEAATFTSRRPRSRIDGIFTDPAIGVAGAGVPVDLVRAEDMAAASDHRPPLARLRLWAAVGCRAGDRGARPGPPERGPGPWTAFGGGVRAARGSRPAAPPIGGKGGADLADAGGGPASAGPPPAVSTE